MGLYSGWPLNSALLPVSQLSLLLQKQSPYSAKLFVKGSTTVLNIAGMATTVLYRATKTYYVELTHHFKTVILEELSCKGQFMSLDHLSSLISTNTQVF